MIILDTDHLSVLHRNAPAAQSFVERLDASDEDCAASIISVEEQMRGWLAEIHRQKKARNQIRSYDHLRRMFAFYAEWNILPWNDDSVDAFENLRKEKIRIATMNLKIAAIAIANDALLLSRNLKDFEKVPGLRVENWID